MLFNSYAFLLLFLPAAIAICAVVDRHERWRMPVMIALSLFFYSYWDVRFLPLMVVSILVNWYLANVYAATRNAAVIVAAIVGNLLVLGFFKYTNFFADNLAALGIPAGHIDVALPLGISFFTFHHVMYLVDLRGGRAPLYPLDRYALYICYFPQAISGPLARWSEVMDQFGRQMLRPGWEQRWALGVALIVVGLLQKVLLADTIANAIDPVFTQALHGPVTDGKSWVALGFAFQLFFDFSGYSDVAIGTALILGVRLPQNFDAPFQATSIREFWRRWHMTLSRFLRDYVYIPLGGNRHGLPRQIAAVIATMAIGGLWHGAGWNFVVWGTLQGLAIAAAVLWSRNLPALPSIVGWAATAIFSVLAFVIFRAGSLDAAWRIYEGLAILPQYRLDGRNTILAAAACTFLLPSSLEICRRLTKAPRLAVPAGLGIAMVTVLVALGERQNYQFVYFQF
jgi:D-alanyl-lipoteichoic acid acyltransferase DltB (MBOAT superfamily)